MKNVFKFFALSALLTCFALFAGSVFAQTSTTGSIEGSVTDSTGAADSTKKDTSAANRNFLASKIKFIPPQQDQQTGKTSYSSALGVVMINDTATVDK